MNNLRDLPSVDSLLQTPQIQEWITLYGRPLTIEAIRNKLDEVRTLFSEDAPIPERESLLRNIEATLQTWTAPTLQAVINATGVILHTNLGRAPLSQAAIQAMQEVTQGFSTLEYDLRKGERGSRSVHAEALLKRLTGAQAALVVNNNAAAVLLVLSTLARRRAVVIARSQLVEIGGGFFARSHVLQFSSRFINVHKSSKVRYSS